MTVAQHIVLFWIFVAFFVLIGIIALLAILGIVSTDKEFRRWAVVGFAAGVSGVLFIWAKSPTPVDFTVNLRPPEDAPRNFELVRGKWEEFQPSAPEIASSNTGSVTLTEGQSQGWTTAKLPYEVVGKAIKLKLLDNEGKWWKTRSFYPNVINEMQLKVTNALEKDATASPSSPTLAASVFTNLAMAAEHEIRFNNCATPFSKPSSGRTYYRWRVFVDEPSETLNSISEVKYLLHPSFPHPLVVRGEDDAKSNFAVQASGWGKFAIQISVTYKNHTKFNTRYQLSLSKSCPDEQHLKGMKILWVDDNPDNNIAERAAFSESGMSFVLAMDTKEALNHLARQKFDVIISDFKRKNEPQGGYELLRNLQQTSSRRTPFIIYSSSATEEQEKQAKKLGAFGETNQPDRLLDLIIAATKR